MQQIGVIPNRLPRRAPLPETNHIHSSAAPALMEEVNKALRGLRRHTCSALSPLSHLPATTALCRQDSEQTNVCPALKLCYSR